MAVLSKSDILLGIDSPRKVEIKQLNGEIWLRPLSSAEVNEVLNIEAQGMGTFNASSNRKGQTSTDGKMNIGRFGRLYARGKMYLTVRLKMPYITPALTERLQLENRLNAKRFISKTENGAKKKVLFMAKKRLPYLPMKGRKSFGWRTGSRNSGAIKKNWNFLAT